jgi:hypothetical protein
MQHTIYVTAEDGTTQQYLLAFQRTYSDADTLLAIYGDGVMIEEFRPDLFYYTYELPVGTEYIPELSWQEADQWQTVTMSQPYNTAIKQINQIDVVAGSGRKNTYTISYEIMQSAVDTLKTIFIGAEEIKGYDPYTTEYYIYLPAKDSVAPNVTWQEGDMYQTVIPQTTPYIINNVQIGWKTTLTVQAQDGHSRVYSIYFLFEQVLSDNTELLNIYLDGEPMSDFDPIVHMYRIAVPYGNKKPSVLAEAAEPMQQIQIAHGDTTIITVTAEDQVTTETYTLIFLYEKSSYAYLEGIYQDEELIPGFRPDSLEYTITLPYGTTTMPTFTYKEGIEGQTVDVETITLAENKLTHIFTVTAPDEESATAYNVLVEVALNDNSRLQTLSVKGTEIENFHADTLNYTILYPIGSSVSEFATLADIQAITEDVNATMSIYSNGEDISIQVVAEDGIHARIYTIHQEIELSSNTRLSALYIAGTLVRDFAPEVTEYTYYVTDAQPSVSAIAEDSTSTIEYGIYAVDAPLYIYVTAQDGSEQVYTIHFVSSTINTSATPNVLDILMKHIQGTKDIAFATIRKNVSVAVYKMNGQMLFHSDVPESNQNDVIMIINANGQEELVDIHTPLTTFTLPEENQQYFYVFYENNKNRIASGKIFFVK